MTIGVRANLRVPQLISRGPEIYSQVRGLELMIIRKQTRDLNTELPLMVN